MLSRPPPTAEGAAKKTAGRRAGSAPDARTRSVPGSRSVFRARGRRRGGLALELTVTRLQWLYGRPGRRRLQRVPSTHGRAPPVLGSVTARGHSTPRRHRRRYRLVITPTGIPDHCADIYGLQVLLKYGMESTAFPRLRHRGGLETGRPPGRRLDWGRRLRLVAVGEGDDRHRGRLRHPVYTDRPPPDHPGRSKYADGKRLVYTANRPRLVRRRPHSDPEPKWCCRKRPPGPGRPTGAGAINISARQAGEGGPGGRAGPALDVTHLWPGRPDRLRREGSEAFGREGPPGCSAPTTRASDHGRSAPRGGPQPEDRRLHSVHPRLHEMAAGHVLVERAGRKSICTESVEDRIPTLAAGQGAGVGVTGPER